MRLMSCVDVYGPHPIATIDFQMEFGVQVLSYISGFMMWPMPSSVPNLKFAPLASVVIPALSRDPLPETLAHIPITPVRFAS